MKTTKYYKQLVTVLSGNQYMHHYMPTQQSVFSELEWNVFATELSKMYGSKGWAVMNIVVIKAIESPSNFDVTGTFPA